MAAVLPFLTTARIPARVSMCFTDYPAPRDGKLIRSASVGLSSARRYLVFSSPNHLTSVSLLQRLRRSQDDDAWRRFVSLYTPLLVAWARKLGVPPHEAGDLVQDVFMRLAQELPRFDYDRGRRFRGWLWTILLNKWRDRRRPFPSAGQ